MVDLPPDVLAAHPEWAAMVNGMGAGDAPIPAPASVPGAPAATYSGAAVPIGSGGPPITAPGTPFQTVAPAAAGGGNPDVAEWQANQNYLAAQQNSIGMQQAANALKPQAQAAARNTIAAKETQNTAQAAYLAEQTRANDAARERQQGIQAAQNDAGNILAVARATAERNTANKYTYTIAGLQAPIEVELPPDYKGPIPPGVVQRLQTLAEVLTKKDADATAMDKFNLEAARIKYANTGIAVTAAEIAEGKVALTLQEAELAASNAGLVAQQAELAARAASQPPAPGLVWDPIAQEWVSQEVLTQRKTQRQVQAQQDAEREQNTTRTLAPFPLDTLESMAVAGAITDEDLRWELQQRNVYLPDTIDAILRMVAARRESSNGQSLGPPPSIGGFGGTTTQPSSSGGPVYTTPGTYGGGASASSNVTLNPGNFPYAQPLQ